LPQDLGCPLQLADAAGAPLEDAKTESLFSSFAEPHRGHFVPSHALERTSTSES